MISTQVADEDARRAGRGRGLLPNFRAYEAVCIDHCMRNTWVFLISAASRPFELIPGG